MKLSSKLKLLIIIVCVSGSAYLGNHLVKSLTEIPEAQKLKTLFPDFDQFSPSAVSRADFSDRKRLFLEWTKNQFKIKMEVIYKINLAEVQNLIKQNDLETFNLFMKQPSPYPGVLTQQAGRDCPDDFVPQTEDKDDDSTFVHKISYFVKKDQNLGACAKEEVEFIKYTLQQYCKLEGIFLEINYALPIAEKEKGQINFDKLVCPQAKELNLIK